MKSPVFSKQRRVSRRAALLLLPMLVLLIADRLIAPHYRLAYNESASLPGTLFLVRVGQLPRCGAEAGEFVQFRMPESARWYRGERLLKVAKGCPGDRIHIAGRQIYINDWFAGEAVPALNDGTAMALIAEGRIPEGHYYMWASHPESFDSRYAEFNVIARGQIIGAATRIF